MAMTEDTRENIVIVDGGICGPATALALHRKGIRSLVLEKSDGLRAAGVAIIVQANGWRALEQLGVASYLRQTAIPVLSGKLNVVGDDELKDLPVIDELRSVKRTDLMNNMADNLPPNTIRFGCSVLSIELDPITSYPVLQLQDGTTLNAKVVIGCDGVNSTVSSMLGVTATNIFNNVCVVRGFTTYPNGHELGSEHRRTKKHDVQVGATPMRTNLVYWFLVAKNVPEKSKISQNQKLIRDMSAATVKDFPSSIKEMVENCSVESLHLSEYLRYQAPWDIARKHFRVGTVTVAGDAWHAIIAMTQFLAQGGSASMEDAVVLARCLAKKISAGIPSGRAGKMVVEEALDEYLRERKPRVLKLSLQSYLLGKMQDTSSRFIKFICMVVMMLVIYDEAGHALWSPLIKILLSF